jgi:hypothetical protein
MLKYIILQIPVLHSICVKTCCIHCILFVGMYTETRLIIIPEKNYKYFMKNYILCTFYLHVRSLFNDAVRNSDYLASNASFPGWSEKNHETLKQGCRCPARNSNLISSEYKSEGMYAPLVAW